MRRIRVFAHVSLDGVISTGNEDATYGDWTARYRSPAGAAALVGTQGTGYDLLLGRRTYDLWSSYWPEVKGGPFADSLNAATKYVATHRPESLEWGPIGNLGVDVLEGIRNLKTDDGPDLLVWGSTILTATLFEQGLVNEVTLVVYPVLMGQGKRFFSDRVAARELAFAGTQTSPTGAQINTYRYVGALASSAEVRGPTLGDPTTDMVNSSIFVKEEQAQMDSIPKWQRHGRLSAVEVRASSFTKSRQAFMEGIEPSLPRHPCGYSVLRAGRLHPGHILVTSARSLLGVGTCFPRHRSTSTVAHLPCSCNKFPR